MAVDLEVHVPFCDHRLVEYVFNAPWAMKNFDGQLVTEKGACKLLDAPLTPTDKPL